MGQGYIYVLANSSMPNMVKVGKTTRQPSLRAQELSSVTGVPTPFVVMYEKQFNNCDFAESFIHELLSIKGFRVSSNREFFNAPIHDVIDTVLQAVSHDATTNSYQDEDDDEYFDNKDNKLDDLVLADKEPLPVWFDIWTEAEKYYHGFGDVLQDFNHAMKLYKQSIKLGCIIAYRTIGNMYLHGEGVVENSKKAFDWYREGAKKENYVCYIDMARLFLLEDRNESNFIKSLQLFCRTRKECFNAFLERESGMFMTIIHQLSFFDAYQIPFEFLEFLAESESEVNEYFEMIEGLIASGNINNIDVDVNSLRLSYTMLRNRV